MSTAPASTRIYRSATGELAVRQWCSAAIGGWPGLAERDPLGTRLGTTRAWRAPGGVGTPVLVLAGTNFNAATSVPLARALAVERPVHLVDLPGQPGLSAGRRPRRNRIAAYGTWLDEVLPQLTDTPVVVLGHSLGAAVALAATPSPLVAGMLLVNPAGLAGAVISPRLLGVTLPWLAAPSPHASARLLDFMRGHPAREAGSPLTEWMTLVGSHCRTSLSPAPLPDEVISRWKGTPLSITTGERDCFFPPNRLRGPARRLLDAPVETMDRTGHLAVEENPARLGELLRELAG